MSKHRRSVYIQEKRYPNPYGLYELTILHHDGKKRREINKDHQVSEKRANKVIEIVGRENLFVELDGGEIVLSATYPQEARNG